MNKRIRRINFISGPGAGKSLTSKNICVRLNLGGYQAELVEESIKEWTYVDRVPKGCDGYFVQAMQIQKEDIRLRSGVDLVVSDSPLILQYFYAMWHKDPLQLSMLKSALEFEKMYPSIHISIQREDKFYSELGRYEKLEEAKKIDAAIEGVMFNNGIDYVPFSCLDQDKIFNFIVSEIGKYNE